MPKNAGLCDYTPAVTRRSAEKSLEYDRAGRNVFVVFFGSRAEMDDIGAREVLTQEAQELVLREEGGNLRGYRRSASFRLRAHVQFCLTHGGWL